MYAKPVPGTLPAASVPGPGPQQVAELGRREHWLLSGHGLRFYGSGRRPTRVLGSGGFGTVHLGGLTLTAVNTPADKEKENKANASNSKAGKSA